MIENNTGIQEICLNCQSDPKFCLKCTNWICHKFKFNNRPLINWFSVLGKKGWDLLTWLLTKANVGVLPQPKVTSAYLRPALKNHPGNYIRRLILISLLFIHVFSKLFYKDLPRTIQVSSKLVKNIILVTGPYNQFRNYESWFFSNIFWWNNKTNKNFFLLVNQICENSDQKFQDWLFLIWTYDFNDQMIVRRPNFLV